MIIWPHEYLKYNKLTEPIKFTCPVVEGDNNLHIEISLSHDKAFSDIILYANTQDSVTNWELFTGVQWEDMPVTGIPPGYQGNRVSFNIPIPYSLEGGRRDDIQGANTTEDWFLIHAPEIDWNSAGGIVGNIFIVSGSTGNDKSYTISSYVADEVGGIDTITIYPEEPIVDDTADGEIILPVDTTTIGSRKCYIRLRVHNGVGWSDYMGDVK